MTAPIEIFFSYAHEDEDLMDAIRRQLIIFDRRDLIRKWHDRKIPPGDSWRRVIDNRIRRAKIILQFLSPHFFDSDYCYEIEMMVALKRHHIGEAVVIPIVLRPCAWQQTPLGFLQALPKDGRAVTAWRNRDQVCLEIAGEIMKVVDQFRLAPQPIKQKKRAPTKKAALSGTVRISV
ncbi:MAG: toll/interleukin-1 receptor domain-containing protein [Candidatus Binatia bacterium]